MKVEVCICWEVHPHILFCIDNKPTSGAYIDLSKGGVTGGICFILEALWRKKGFDKTAGVWHKALAVEGRRFLPISLRVSLTERGTRGGVILQEGYIPLAKEEVRAFTRILQTLAEEYSSLTSNTAH
jgi:hypothetical protein